MSFDHLLARSATWVLLLAAGWLGALLMAAAVEAVSRGRLPVTRWTGAPPWLRAPLVALAAGILSTVGLGATAAGASDTSGHPVGAEALAGLRLPDRPVGGLVSQTPPETVVVRAGDSLWAIARRRSPDASAGAIAATVRALHEHNAAVIGPDPDLIHPGQRLRVPPLPRPTPDRQERR
jgi:nucleoid-associated protein YgaU